MTFDTNVHRQFFLNQYDDRASVLSALSHVPYNSGATYTQRALEYMRTMFFTSTYGARAGVPKVSSGAVCTGVIGVGGGGCMCVCVCLWV